MNEIATAVYHWFLVSSVIVCAAVAYLGYLVVQETRRARREKDMELNQLIRWETQQGMRQLAKERRRA